MFIWKCLPAAMTSEPHHLYLPSQWQSLANKCLYMQGLFAREKFVFIFATEGRSANEQKEQKTYYCAHTALIFLVHLNFQTCFYYIKCSCWLKYLSLMGDIKKISCISSNIKGTKIYIYFKLWWPKVFNYSFSITFECANIECT